MDPLRFDRSAGAYASTVQCKRLVVLLTFTSSSVACMSFSPAQSLAILIWVAASATPLAAEDWPQWRGPDRTGHISNHARVPVALPAQLGEVWHIGIGQGLASPIIAGGKVFYFDNQAGKETIHALTASDARELWRATVDDALTDEQGPSGPRCTPMVDDDLLYAQSGKGELQCLRVDGRLIWRINFMKDFGAAFLGEDSPVPGAAEHNHGGAGDRWLAFDRLRRRHQRSRSRLL